MPKSGESFLFCLYNQEITPYSFIISRSFDILRVYDYMKMLLIVLLNLVCYVNLNQILPPQMNIYILQILSFVIFKTKRKKYLFII